jgi:alpha-L-rhamnosidase
MGYPELKVSGGKGSSIQVKYAEALYEKVNLKAHRDSVNNLTMYGVWDVFRPDGPERTFRPLWKRCFRYVQLVIGTGDEPLQVLSHENEYSGYPYPDMATFKSDNEKLNEIFDICLRTLQMCSGETYYDTPFYEQLSYGGDNRPIGMNSIYNSTDDQLFREVMRLYPQSENRETGLFKSAYPSRFDFDMGSWSLAWIQSLKDYYYLRGDKEYVSQFVDNIEKVLGFYERHLDESIGILGTVRNKNFMDWSITKGSIPRADENQEMRHTVLLTLYFVHSLDCTVKLYEEIGEQQKAAKWAAMSANIKKAIKTHCWDEEKQLFRDYPEEDIYSQHSNILAIICDVVEETDQKSLMQRILNYKDFDEFASSYFSFYLFKAMDKVGLQDEFLHHLDFWYTFLERGHTTAGETGFASHDRSDCHAWAAHPSYYLLSLVAGIKPADIGFNSVKIAPHPGDLTNIQASIPHPKGKIQVDYKVKNGKIKGTIVLPEGVSGEWNYGEETMVLYPGENMIK